MIDRVRLVYAALGERSPGDAEGLLVRDLDVAVPGVRLAIDPSGRHHLLVESPSGPTFQTGLAAITASHHDLVIGGRTLRHLDVVCEIAELAEVFDHFVASVAEQAVANDEVGGDLVLASLDRWRSFFAEIGPPPGRGTVTGVVAELLVLKDLAALDGPDALAVWVGPRGGRHDFRRADVAVEVKATRAHTSRVVTIHGEDQLETPEPGTLHLHFIRLEEVAGVGVSVSDLVDDLVSLGVPRLSLFEALDDAGLPLRAFAQVGNIRFDVRERATFPIDGSTPRIVASTFATGERPVGIVDLTYRVDLDHVADTAISAEAYRDLMTALTSGSAG